MKVFFNIIFLIASISILGQGKTISGKVVNDWKEPLENVLVSVKGKKTRTDCKGKFKISINKGERLTYFKSKYISREITIQNKRKFKITMNYDYKQAIYELNKDSLNVKSLSSGGQPLYVVNGIPYIYKHPDKSPIYTGEDVKSIKILKGKLATEKFGNYARNGLFWISIKCGRIK